MLRDEQDHSAFAQWATEAETDDLRTERDRIVAKVADIEVQLTDPNKLGHEGERLDDHSYHSWRRSALAAKGHLSIDLRATKAELNRRSQDAHNSRLDRIEAKVDRILTLVEEEDE